MTLLWLSPAKLCNTGKCSIEGANLMVLFTCVKVNLYINLCRARPVRSRNISGYAKQIQKDKKVPS